jgi:hypothetical protein
LRRTELELPSIGIPSFGETLHLGI